MSKIAWKAKIYLESADSKININSLPILSFQVKGGAMRTVHLDSADDMEIAFELDEARDFKNIQIFIAASNGLAAAQLIEAAAFKKRLDAMFFIESTSGDKKLKGFTLRSKTALITRHPVATQRQEQRTLKIELALPNPILQERIINGQWQSSKDI